MFTKTARRQFGAGNNLIAEMCLNEKNKYKNFFRMGPKAFDELLSLVGPYLKKVDSRREPISPKTRLAVTLR